MNQDLIKAITEHNVANVLRCLQKGANPNYTWTYSKDSNVNLSSLQPTTPLSLLIFVISDCLHSEKILSQYLEITKILLVNNADPKPAILLAIERYGKYRKPKEPSIFDNIYRLVSEAYSKIGNQK